MTPTTTSSGLDRAGLGYLRYLQGLANQPPGSWAGFYRTPSDGMNFGLRFQLAFAGYAIYALARRTPAYRQPYQAALKALIEKMLLPEVWAYWFKGAVPPARHIPLSTPASPGLLHQAAGGVHNRLGAGPGVSPDPCLEGNIQYSAHLSALIGFYELLSGDSCYDKTGFTLQAEAGGQTYHFPYTYTSLARRIHEQMRDSHFGGACCEPGRAYAACNNHACISNLLYDRLYGTNLARVNRRWAAWVEGRMLTGGRKGGLPWPAPNGLLSMAYMPGLHLPVPFSFNLTDAWGLAFMAAWEPDFVRDVYPRLLRRLKAEPDGSLYLDSASLNSKLEISTTELNTAFAAVLAREMGDQVTYNRLLAWCDARLDLQDNAGTGRYYAAARPAPYVTALLALAQAGPDEGGGQYSLLKWQPVFNATCLSEVSAGIEVSRAEWSAAESRLTIEWQAAHGSSSSFKIANCARPSSINYMAREVIIDGTEASYSTQASLLTITLRPAEGPSESRHPERLTIFTAP